jgi:DNA polymerase-3 subunit epsilon
MACRLSSWADKPLFAAIVDEFLNFVGNAPLVAHNAGFNVELKRAARRPIAGGGSLTGWW